MLGDASRDRAFRNDDINLESDKLGRESWKLIIMPVRRSPLDGDVLSFHIANVAEPLAECLTFERSWGEGSRQDAYPRDLCRLLRIGGERGGEES